MTKRKKKPGHWIGFGVAIGAGMGVALGNIALGMGVGVALGAAMAVGQKKKSNRLNKKENGNEDE